MHRSMSLADLEIVMKLSCSIFGRALGNIRKQCALASVYDFYLNYRLISLEYLY